MMMGTLVVFGCSGNTKPSVDPNNNEEQLNQPASFDYEITQNTNSPSSNQLDELIQKSENKMLVGLVGSNISWGLAVRGNRDRIRSRIDPINDAGLIWSSDGYHSFHARKRVNAPSNGEIVIQVVDIEGCLNTDLPHAECESAGNFPKGTTYLHTLKVRYIIDLQEKFECLVTTVVDNNASEKIKDDTWLDVISILVGRVARDNKC
ncbi:MAG: hypothetical protein OXC40_07800 [Proteobacteria bacterium]|nr:hypothetical protein [Pseudomonadota bacterium]